MNDNSMKNACVRYSQRPRPDFLSRCYPEKIPEPLVFADTSTCPGNEETVIQGLKSFPSGHASCESASRFLGGLMAQSHARFIYFTFRNMLRVSDQNGVSQA